MPRERPGDDQSASSTDELRPPARDMPGAGARLVEAADSGAPVELILVLRGTVRPFGDHRRGLWRIDLSDGHHRVFAADSVIAATPIGRGRLRD